MSRIRALFYSILALMTVASGLRGQTNRVFAFPSGGNLNVTVLDATTLASLGTITATPQAFQAFVTPDGSKYYIVSGNPVHTVTIANASSLAVLGYLDAGANASTAALTPNGKYLLVSAGTLKVYSTATDTLVADLNVGAGGGADVAVSNDSTRAYVMNTSAGRISVIDLTLSPPAAATPNAFTIGSPLSMVLRPDNRDLLVLVPGGLDLVNTKTGAIFPGPNNSPPTIPLFQLSGGKIVVTPDSSKAIAVNTGLAPANVSYFIDLSLQTTTQIGPANQGFSQVVLVNNTTAFGIVSATDSTNGSVAIINLASGTVPIGTTVQTTYGANTKSIAVSPNGGTVYLASFANSSVTRVDVTSNLATPKTLGVAPTGEATVFAPATTGAASIVINGGDQQNVIAGQNANTPLSVKVTDSNGNPVYNVPVTFTTTATGVTLTPATAPTNANGIAAVTLSVAAPSSQTAESSSALSAEGDGAVNQFVTSIGVQASAPGAGGVNFSLTISSGSGLVLISGDNQITAIQQPFGQPLVVRLTDQNGFPIPNAPIDFFPQNQAVIIPNGPTFNTDINGFVSVQVLGGRPPFGLTSFLSGVNVRVDQPGILPSNLNSVVTFSSLTVTVAPPSGPFAASGDMQTGTAGSTLPSFLCVNLSANGNFLPGQVAVTWKAVSGPGGTGSASFNPPVTIGAANGLICTQVTLGPKAGTQPIIVSASVPGLFPGTATFTLFARTGPASRLVKIAGDGQTGKPGTLLPVRVQVQVTDQFGNPSSGAFVSFNVTQGAASLAPCITSADANGNVSCPVTLGPSPGTVTIVASIGSVSVTFTETAAVTATALVAVSGSNQHVPLGGSTVPPLVVKAVDAQGNGVGGVPVMVSGPSTVTLVPTSGALGNPITSTSAADGTVTFTARAGPGTPLGTLTLTASFSISGVNASLTLTLIVDGAKPVFTANQVVNAASNVSGMVPYGLATIYGTGLSQVSGIAMPGGATTFQGVTVKIDGVAVPLYAISNQNGQEQINFQVRSDLGTPSTVTVEVNNNGAVTDIPNVQVLPVQPGIFEYTPQGSNTKYAAALKTDGSVVGPSNPVARGDAFSAFLTGGGPTLPLLQAGQAAPTSPPLATTFLQPAVGIGGHGATVQFSGLAPGFVGLYQINIVVPADAPVGSAVTLDIVMGGAASQTSHIAVQ